MPEEFFYEPIIFYLEMYMSLTGPDGICAVFSELILVKNSVEFYGMHLNMVKSRKWSRNTKKTKNI